MWRFVAHPGGAWQNNKYGISVMPQHDSPPLQKHPTIETLGGLITCRRCQAKSKHTGKQCRKAAMKGKAVCRTHGGASTGPKTAEGRKRCAAARTTHGQETTAMRKEYREASARLAELEEMAYLLGIMSGARKMRRRAIN